VNKRAKSISTTAICVVVLLTIFVLVGRDLWLRRSETLTCDDGTRKRIDIRDFTTQYSAYSIQLEATVAGRGRLATKLNPIQLQQVSEATQNAQDFRKFVVAGFNSCAITKAQYAQLGGRFQTLDSLAREINDIAAHSSISTNDKAKLTALIEQYAQVARKLTSD
jgi:hypothetical protein